MKKIIIITLLIGLANIMNGQSTKPNSNEKDYKNVISVDATSLLAQFLNLSNTTFTDPPYVLTYRRFFNNNNAFRIGIGGYAKDVNYTTNDSLSNNQISNSFNIGLGYEHYSYLSERWNLYYGADLILRSYYNFSKSSITTTREMEQTNKSIGYGVSPLLGVQFILNSRLSISTETSFDLTFSQNNSSRKETPSTAFDKNTEGSTFETNFNAPITINFRVIF